MQSFSRSKRSTVSGTNRSTENDDCSQPYKCHTSDCEHVNICNICLEVAKDTVISLCGHMFCWPCLYQWLYSGDITHDTCPVCKSAISREKVIPVYKSGDESNKQDPRDKIPPRPSSQRSEVPNQHNQFPYGNVWAMGGPGAQIFGFGDGGFHMSFGIGSLPQYILAFLQEYTANDRRNEAEVFFTKFFAICGIACMLLTLYFCWLILFLNIRISNNCNLLYLHKYIVLRREYDMDICCNTKAR